MAQQYSWMGVGRVLIRVFGSGDPFIFMGNASDLGIKIKDKETKQQDFASLGGGTLASVSRIEGVTLETTVTNISPANIAMAIRGAISAMEATTAITAEIVHVGAISAGGVYPLARLPDLSKPMTVKAAETTFVEGEDYARTISGIELLAGTNIVKGEVTVSYTPIIEDVIEAIVGAQKEFELLFEGMNEALDGIPRIVEAYRWKPSPSDCDYIGDKFGAIKLSGELLRDESKIGVGKSKYFRERMARTA